MRVAVVTGAARGIGAATVRALAEQGYAVLAVDACAGPDGDPYPLPTEADLDAVVAPYEHAVAHVADVRDAAAVGAAVDATLERWGRVDAAVAAAAVITGGRPLWETPDTDLDLLWEVDLKGVWHTAAAAIPAMLAGPDPSGCRFVALASTAGEHGLFHLSAYTVVKHAVIGLVRGLAADLAGTGVTACAVAPGATDTDLLRRTAALYPGTSSDDLAAHQALRRPLTPAEVAATVAFCCSRPAAALHGSVVAADGGFGL